MSKKRCSWCGEIWSGYQSKNADPDSVMCPKCYGKFSDETDEQPEYCYGFFPGGDPRDFTPDYELCTKEEVMAWQKDCLSWNTGGEKRVCPPCCEIVDTETTHLVITTPRYGIGVYRVR